MGLPHAFPAKRGIVKEPETRAPLFAAKGLGEGQALENRVGDQFGFQFEHFARAKHAGFA